MLVGDSSLPVDEEGLGYSPDTVINGKLPARISPIQISNPELFQKTPSVFFFVLDVDSEKNNTAVLVFLPACLPTRGDCM
jgi:hypothetical protein